MIWNLDGKAQAEGYAKQGAEVIKEEARLIGPGRIRTGDRQHQRKARLEQAASGGNLL